MGIAGLFITGVVAGAILFSVLRALRGRYAYVSGFFLGLLAAIAVIISSYLGKTTVAPPMVSALWILFVFSSWGMSFGVAYLRLSDLSASISDLPSVQRVSRRKFLIRLAGFTATITVSGAMVGLLSERHSRMKLSSLMPWSA